jgi:hypothetical protein
VRCQQAPPLLVNFVVFLHRFDHELEGVEISPSIFKNSITSLPGIYIRLQVSGKNSASEGSRSRSFRMSTCEAFERSELKWMLLTPGGGSLRTAGIDRRS